MTAVTLEKQEHAFSPYPEAMDNFFTKNTVTIKILPDGYIRSIETGFSDFQITSASQYINYINGELAFWEEKDPTNKLAEYARTTALKSAKSYFNNALTSYKSAPSYPGNGDSHMRNSISAISAGSIYSKTSIAAYMIEHINEHADFFKGLKYGLQISKTTSFSATTGTLEGFNAALSFRGHVQQIRLSSVPEIDKLNHAISSANENLAQLNNNYTTAFHNQEARLASITNQTNTHLQTLTDEAKKYYADRDHRCAELEKLYEEKLRLKAPAEYWREIEEEYTFTARLWLLISIVTAIAIVVVLITALALFPNMFSDESHWFEIFKNSAILTAIASIAIYMLRLFVKLSTSAYHLSRDAKERNKLTYFYLALIEGKAVTEKERAIILNSLFSRSDSGLLKGDSSPTMSYNIADLVEKLQSK